MPYLLGEGQAMMYSVRPKAKTRSRIANLPFGTPPDNYLRDAMVTTLPQTDVEFDFLVQVQTDPHRMPIENAGVRWPEKLSPFVPVATLRIPRQTSIRRRNSRSRTTFRTSPGTACRSIGRWATRAARASGCISSSATFASG